MKIAVLAITRHGVRLARRVLSVWPQAQLVIPEKFRAEAEHIAAEQLHCYEGKVSEQLAQLFATFDALVAFVSLGAVVRLIAPHLKNKEVDPAVIVIDEAGKFVIPVLSGHVGGANQLSADLAQALSAQAVLTTASDVRETIAVDLLGRELGWKLEASHDEIVRCSAAMVNDEAVALVQEVGSNNWWIGHANGRSGALPSNVTVFQCLEEIALERYAVVLWIAERSMPEPWAQQLHGRCVRYRP